MWAKYKETLCNTDLASTLLREEKKTDRVRFEGIFAPHVTPFGKQNSIDVEALKMCIQFWIKSGLDGFVTCGSNGEAPYLSRAERKLVIRTVLDEVSGRVPVVAGTGSMSTWKTIQLTKDAEDLGAAAALVVTPFYFKLSNREIYEHYKSISEAVDIPIILYSVPKFTGFHLDISIISRLASKYKNVVGVKDSGGSLGRITEIARSVGDSISVLAGTADVTLPTLMLGGTGAVIAVANVIPKMCANLYAAFKKGELERASKLQREITRTNEIIMKYGQISTIKATLNLIGMPSGYPRRPVLPLSKETEREMASQLKPMLEPS